MKNKNNDWITLFSMSKLLELALPLYLISAIFAGCVETFKPDPNYRSPGMRQELKKLQNLLFE